MLTYEKQNSPTTSLNENCLDFEFKTDRKYYVVLRQTFLVLKVNFVKVVVTKLTIPNKTKKSTKRATADEKATMEEEQEAPVSLVTHVKNLLHSYLSDVQVYIKIQQN